MKDWQNLFDTHALMSNVRKIRKIEISKERDGALAVVDIRTVWRDKARKRHCFGKVTFVRSTPRSARSGR